jgi:hypothetical protein
MLSPFAEEPRGVFENDKDIVGNIIGRNHRTSNQAKELDKPNSRNKHAITTWMVANGN